MGDKKFISPEFSLAIQNYLITKDQEFSGSLSFPVIVIRTLIFIYGELDIINPYITKNEDNLGGFDSNITKYGFSNYKLQDFKQQFNSYVRTSNEQEISAKHFLKLEFYLIDMFFLKKKAMHFTDEEVLKFKDYLCLSTNPKLQDYYELYLKGNNVLDYYFASKYFDSNHNYQLSVVSRNILNMDAYLILGYSPSQIANMSDDELKEINNKVYQFFKIPDTETNKSNLLIQAVNYYKKYGNRITSGNGYVDLLLLMSVLITSVFIIMLVAVNVF